MKIVFLVHYFPPLNSSGAKRVVAFSKYLNSFGHLVSVISTVKTTADGPLTEDIPDFCNLIEVSWLKNKLHEPANTQALNEGRSTSGNFLVKLKRRIMKYFGQLLDHRLFFSFYFLKFRLPKSVNDTLKNADVIISSCPPWPTHLAGLICSKRFKKKWIADYRDQFSGNHIFSGTAFSRFLEDKIERWLLKNASAVLVISSPMKEYYMQYSRKVYCIENGYDQEQFEKIKMLDKSNHKKNRNEIYIRYMGLVSKDRIPNILFEALSKIEKKSRDLIKVEFYGEASLVKEFLIEKFPDLLFNVNFFTRVPHNESLKLMLMSDVLLLKESSDTSSKSSQGILTTKLFEYLASKKPIIAEVSPSTLMGKLVIESGLCCACTLDENEMQKSLTDLVLKKIIIQPNIAYIQQFSRKKKTLELETIIKNIV